MLLPSSSVLFADLSEGWLLGAGNEADEMSTDDPEIYDGAHVSLQIVGGRLQEEKMLAIAEHIEQLIGPRE